MINNIAYFPSQCAQNSRPVMSAVLDYLQARGIQTQENSMESDAAVIWSVLWAGRMAPNQAVYQHYRSQGKPVVIIEILGPPYQTKDQSGHSNWFHAQHRRCRTT